MRNKGEELGGNKARGLRMVHQGVGKWCAKGLENRVRVFDFCAEGLENGAPSVLGAPFSNPWPYFLPISRQISTFLFPHASAEIMLYTMIISVKTASYKIDMF